MSNGLNPTDMQQAEMLIANLPRIPARDAPQGKWCIGFVAPCEESRDFKFPEGAQARQIERSSAPCQCINIGGAWFQLSGDGSPKLQAFQGHRGKASYVITMHIAILTLGQRVSAPDEVVVLPHGRLEPGWQNVADELNPTNQADLDAAHDRGAIAGMRGAVEVLRRMSGDPGMRLIRGDQALFTCGESILAAVADMERRVRWPTN